MDLSYPWLSVPKSNEQASRSLSTLFCCIWCTPSGRYLLTSAMLRS